MTWMGTFLYDDLGGNHDDRKIDILKIPTSLDSGLILIHRFPMKPEEYDFMIKILGTLKDRIVEK